MNTTKHNRQFIITSTFSSAAFLVSASIQVRSSRLLMNTWRMSLIISSIWCSQTHTCTQWEEDTTLTHITIKYTSWQNLNTNCQSVQILHCVGVFLKKGLQRGSSGKRAHTHTHTHTHTHKSCNILCNTVMKTPASSLHSYISMWKHSRLHSHRVGVWWPWIILPVR